MPRFMCRSLVAVLLLLALPSAAHPAPRFSIGGFGGLGLPEKSLIDGTEPFRLGDTDFIGFLFLKQRGSVAFGGRSSLWLTNRVAVEAEVGWLPSEGDFRAAIEEPAGSGEVQLGYQKKSVNSAVYGLVLDYAIVSPPLEPMKVYLSAGAGIVRRSGELLDLLEGEGESVGGSDPAFIAGVGLRYGLSSTLFFRTDFRDYISSFDPTIQDDGRFVEAKTQHDVFLTVGLEFALTR